MTPSVLPTVFITGRNAGPEQWKSHADYLRQHNVPHVQLDYRSFDNIENMARHTLAAVPGRFSLCGYSMGGYVALAAFRMAPERVASIVLCHTNALDVSPEQKMQHQKFVAEYAPSTAGLHDRHKMACLQRRSSFDLLPDMKIPALVIGSKDDVVTPLAQQVELARLIPHSHLHVLDHGGHHAVHQQADQTMPLILTAVMANVEPQRGDGPLKSRSLSQLQNDTPQ